MSAETRPDAEAHGRYMRYNGDRFKQFMRNGVWGTCVDCPRDNTNAAYPEFCENFGRYDHKLTPESLFEQYHNAIK